GIEEDAWRYADLDAQGGTHQCFDWSNMRNKHNALIGMSQRQLLYTGADALLHCYHALTTGRRYVRIIHPFIEILRIFWTARQYFSAIHALPYAETTFVQRVEFLNGEVVALGNGYGCVIGALHRTAIHCRDGQHCQSISQLRSL